MRHFMMPKRKIKKIEIENDVEIGLNHNSQCSRCKTIFGNDFTKCPECGSSERVGYTELNPYTRLPLENFLQACGHLFWLGGTFLFLYCLWEIGETELPSEFFVILAFAALGIGILMSALYFALSEVITRLLRVQRRLRAFHLSYNTGASTNFSQRRRTRQRKAIH